MRKIDKIFVQYKDSILKIEQNNLIELQQLKEAITLSKKCVHHFSQSVRLNDFNSKESEIDFFKYQKPFVKGRLKYYTKLHSYIQECPKGNIEQQRKYINNELELLEIQKSRQLEFFNYYKHNENCLDEIYFLRGKNKFDFFVDTSYYYDDPEFSTLHDYMASKIVAYDLLTTFFEKQLKNLKIKETSLTNESTNSLTKSSLNWTASKTDLVELIFALQAAGVIQNGKGEISKIAKTFSETFNVELGNIHKTFAEICARENSKTKFIDQLIASLNKKIASEN